MRYHPRPAPGRDVAAEILTQLPPSQLPGATTVGPGLFQCEPPPQPPRLPPHGARPMGNGLEPRPRFRGRLVILAIPNHVYGGLRKTGAMARSGSMRPIRKRSASCVRRSRRCGTRRSAEWPQRSTRSRRDDARPVPGPADRQDGDGSRCGAGVRAFCGRFRALVVAVASPYRPRSGRLCDRAAGRRAGVRTCSRWARDGLGNRAGV
jgi:hypothetical protein